MVIETRSEQPAVLRVSEKYDGDWKAIVDGKPAKVLRVDYIFQGVFLDAGTHTVALRYAPDNRLLVLQALGMLIGLGAIVCSRGR